MKKILSLILVATLLCACVFTLASCGNKPSGTYKDEAGFVTLEFKGNKVTVSALGESKSGTFKIVKDGEDLEIEITMEVGDEKETESSSYEKGDDYIKIAGVKYIKQ